MSTVYGHILRRGLNAVAAPPAGPREQHIETLRAQAQVYENTSGPSIQPWQILALAFTCIACVLFIAAIQYTIDEVIMSLAMVEQPRTLILSESKPAESDEPDAPLEKATLLDQEVAVFREQPMTASISKTVKHLQKIGGFRARWRGIRVAAVYGIAHNVAASLIAMLVSGLFVDFQHLFVVASVMASVLLARIRMTWTHVKISHPSELPWYKRVPSDRRHFKTLALPALFRAVSTQLCVYLPMGVWQTMPGVPGQGSQHQEVCRALAAAATLVFVGLALVLPSAVTLTRVEASLLPEDQETIVNFDRTLNGATVSPREDGVVDPRTVFVAAWRSFDRASRLRLLKLISKAVGIYAIAYAAFGVFIAAQLFFIGPEKLGAFVVAGHAQLRLAQMGVPQD